MDNKAAIKFLKLWDPSGPWVLTAIQVDRKGIETRTFHPDKIDDLDMWLMDYNGKRNIYFHVNSVLYDLKTKANREDIKSVDWFHIDIDPEPDMDLDKERKRCLELLTSDLPKGVPAPTAIVFSGGGYQGFWKLKEPIPIDGDLGLAEEAKRFNQQLEALFGADNCHNIDRIMRLPGTVNIPDARKKKKGRSKETAKVLEFNDNVYSVDDFTKAPLVQMQTGGGGFGGAATKVLITGNIKRVADLDELNEWNVPDRVKVIIAQGRHPEEPKEGDNSRSAWLFDCVCQLARAEVPDEVIYSILTDPDWGIASSVVECGRGADKYAIRQIERAKDWVIDPNLVKMNDQFAVIGNMGGKCRVVEEVYDAALNRTRITKQSFEDLKNRYAHIKVKIGTDANDKPITKKLGHWWYDNPKRRQYDYIGFSPSGDTPNTYNLWKGFACESIPGEIQPYLDHIKNNVCSGNQEYYDYLIGWMARTVQFPGSPGEVAIVMRGGRGTGKSFFATKFGDLFGRHFLQVSNSGHLVGNFNSHLRDTIVLFADEAFFAGDRRHASVLKTLITEKTIPIESKGVDVETAPNYVHLLMASNEDHVVPAGGDERRFFVVDVGSDVKQNSKYFRDIAELMDNGGREALLHFLMTYDLKGYNVRDVPKTDALKEQKLLSLNVEQEWWYQKLCEGRLNQSHLEWQTTVTKDEVIDDFIDNARRFNVNRRGTATALGRFLMKMVPNLDTKQMNANIERVSNEGYTFTDKKRCWHYLFPSIEECRKAWELKFGEEDWPEYSITDEAELDTGVPF